MADTSAPTPDAVDGAAGAGPAHTSPRQLWLVEAVDVLSRRAALVGAVIAGIVVVAAALAWLRPALLPPTPLVGAAIGFAAVLLGAAAAIAVDAADTIIRGPRHVGAAGGELVAVLPRLASPRAAAGLAAEVLAAKGSAGPLLLGLASTGRGVDRATGWSVALARAVAETGASVLHVDLASGRSLPPGLLEVLRSGDRIASAVTFEPGQRLAWMGAGSDRGSALDVLPQLRNRLPSDLDVLIVALPPAESRQVVNAAGCLDTTLLVVEAEVTARVDLIAGLDAIDTVGSKVKVLLLDDLTAERLAPQPTAAPAGLLDGAADPAAAPGVAAGRTSRFGFGRRGGDTEVDDADLEPAAQAAAASALRDIALDRDAEPDGGPATAAAEVRDDDEPPVPRPSASAAIAASAAAAAAAAAASPLTVRVDPTVADGDTTAGDLEPTVPAGDPVADSPVDAEPTAGDPDPAAPDPDPATLDLQPAADPDPAAEAESPAAADVDAPAVDGIPPDVLAEDAPPIPAAGPHSAPAPGASPEQEPTVASAAEAPLAPDPAPEPRQAERDDAVAQPDDVGSRDVDVLEGVAEARAVLLADAGALAPDTAELQAITPEHPAHPEHDAAPSEPQPEAAPNPAPEPDPEPAPEPDPDRDDLSTTQRIQPVEGDEPLASADEDDLLRTTARLALLLDDLEERDQQG